MRQLQRAFQWAMVLGWGLSLLVANGVFAPDAIALTQVKLKNLGYKDCPVELSRGAVVSAGLQSANCFLVTGTAINNTEKYVVDADVFGRIYDANGNNVFQNRGRVGTIPEVPPGESEFAIRITVAANQATPLKLKQFRASGFASRVRPAYYDHTDDDDFLLFDSDFDY